MTLKTTEIIKQLKDYSLKKKKKRNKNINFGNSDKHEKKHRSSIVGMEQEISLQTSVSLKGYLEKTNNRFMFINSTI